MAAGNPGAPAGGAPQQQQQLTLEQKIEQAAAESAQIVAIFSQPAAEAIAAGADAEPIISTLVHAVLGLFRAKVTAAASATAQK